VPHPTLSNIATMFVDICSLFNQPCILCGSRTAQHGLCPACRCDIVRLPNNKCRQCALPLLEGTRCGRCLHKPPAFDALHVPYEFCHPLSALIHAFKYGKRLELAGILTRLMTETTYQIPDNIDIVIAVPLAKERLAERGFNQSIELARALTAIIPNRFSPNLCWRKCNTVPQAGLDLRERRRNLRNAFCVETRLDGLSVAIVDDVATSGATLDSLASTLKKQGAKRVEAWVLARTLSLNT
jgi:ComF family protein